MILIKKLILNNFLSHEHTEVVFSSNEKLLLDGTSGAGKSSVFDAIIWALYGQGRTDNRNLVRKGEKKGSVVLELDRDGNDTVIITRETTTGGKHTLEISIRDATGATAAYPLSGIRELQAWIDKDLIGASYLLFVNSVAYVQGNTEVFVAQSASKRKELLLEIVKAEDYKKYYENARQGLSRLENDRSMLQGRIIELEAQLVARKAHIGDRQGYLDEIRDKSVELKDIDITITRLEAEKSSLSTLDQTLQLLDKTLRTAMSDRDAAQAAFDKRNNMLSCNVSTPLQLEEKMMSLRNDLSNADKILEQHEQLDKEKPVLIDRSKEITRTMEKMEKIGLQPVCPSGKDCPYSGTNQEEVLRLSEYITEAEKVSKDEEAELATWKEKLSKLPSKVDVRTIMSEINAVSAELRAVEADKVIREELIELGKDIGEKQSRVIVLSTEKIRAEESMDKEAINRISADLTQSKNQKRELETGITRATIALQNIENNEKEAAKLDADLADIRDNQLSEISEKAKKIALVKDAFGSKGIETMVVDYLLPKLEDKINEILSKLSDFRVRLDTQRKSADGESTVEGLFIFVSNEAGEEMDFSNFSGGEKVRITIAISEALATLHKSIGFRLMDEAIFGLSSEMIQDFTEVLTELQTQYPQILCVSHLIEVKSMFEKVATIKKHNGISTLST
jgi:exonuclease SbcC